MTITYYEIRTWFLLDIIITNRVLKLPSSLFFVNSCDRAGAQTNYLGISVKYLNHSTTTPLRYDKKKNPEKWEDWKKWWQCSCTLLLRVLKQRCKAILPLQVHRYQGQGVGDTGRDRWIKCEWTRLTIKGGCDRGFNQLPFLVLSSSPFRFPIYPLCLFPFVYNSIGVHP